MNLQEQTDEEIIEEIMWELEDAKLMIRKPIFFVSSDEQRKRLKRLFPIAVERVRNGEEKQRKMMK